MTRHAESHETTQQFIRYAFFKVTPDWRYLSHETRDGSKHEFATVLGEIAEDYLIRPYCLIGTRGDVDFMLWQATDTLDEIHEISARLNATHLARYSAIPYSYLALTRTSPYFGSRSRGNKALPGASVYPVGAKYMFVYPFVKNRDWYKLPHEIRSTMMREHVVTGAKYPSVTINTGYSFGLDDQEFTVAFETDSPSDFLNLVMDMRESQASSYTLRDTPIFSCIAMDIQTALSAIAG